ncbi:MAG: hypothetical protein GY859_37690 [Desulfobacterales bacterium]|nr:hypothetical protein [Desulfobacterales bacterium]
MIRKVFTVSVVLFIFALAPGAAQSATPFQAPATFVLENSTFDFSVSFTFPRVGEVGVAVNPSPTPVTGNITIDELEMATGLFTGSFNNITGSTAAAHPLLEGLVITLTLNSENVSGKFLWAQNKVILYAETLEATLSFSGGFSWPVPLNGAPVPATYQNDALSISTGLNKSGEYSGYTFNIDVAVDLTANLQAQPAVAAWTEIKTDRTAYGAGDPLKLYLSVGTGGAARVADLYLVLEAPDQTIYSWPTYGMGVVPAAVGLPLPADLNVTGLELFDVVLPSTIPLAPGDQPYKYHFVMADTGTADAIGAIASASFTYAGAAVAPAYDGTWTGTALCPLNNEVCSSFNEVEFLIADGRITGYGVDDEQEEYPVTGVVDGDGNIVDGVIYEDDIPIGVFDGSFSGAAGSGTWHDHYGCYGTFNVTKNPAAR